MATPRDKYYTEWYRTIIDCKDRTGALFSNEKILDATHRVIVKYETEAHNITMDNFYQYPVTPNTQGENENAILTSGRLNNSDTLAKTLKVLTINYAGYYNPDKIMQKAILQAVQR